MRSRNSRHSITIMMIIIIGMLTGCNQQIVPVVVDSEPSASAESLTPKAVEILRQSLSDPDPRIRSNAAEIVAEVEYMSLMPQVRQLVNDRFVPVRFAAALAIGQVNYTPGRLAVKKLLEDPDGNVRIAAAYALARLGETKYFKELLPEAISSGDQTLRANAAFLMGKSGDNKALKYLYWALQNEDSQDKVRFQAIEAIAALGDEKIYEKVWAMLISAYADERAMGIRAMGALGTVRAKDALLTMLDDDVPELRIMAAEQLGRLGDNSGSSEIHKLFDDTNLGQMEEEAQERIKILCAMAIGQNNDDSLKSYLPGLIDDDSKLVQIAAAGAVINSYRN